MEPRKIDVNGCLLTMKMMDTSYVICEDEISQGVTVDVGCRALSPCWPNPLYSAYYRKILGAYGVGPVLVWDDKRVVGFLPMSVTGCDLPQLPLCIHYTGGLAYGAERDISLAMIEDASPRPFEQLAVKEVRIGCMSVHHTIRGQSFAKLMIEYMIHWAKQHGWDKVTARAMMDGEPMSFYPTHSFWIRQGFKPVGPVRTFGITDDPYEQAKAIDLEYDLKV